MKHLIFKYSANAVFFLLVALASYFLAALVLSLLPSRNLHANCQRDRTVYLADNGVHLDIIFPARHYASWMEELPLAKNHSFLAFGWGDKGFYLNTPEWKDLKLSTVLNALRWDSEAALHLTGYSEKPIHWIELEICSQQMVLLQSYIRKSFSMSDHLRFLEIPQSGYGVNDTFYQATGSYSIFSTCNQWVNRGLKKAGLPSSKWSPFSFGVKHHLERSELKTGSSTDLPD